MEKRNERVFRFPFSGLIPPRADSTVARKNLQPLLSRAESDRKSHDSGQLPRNRLAGAQGNQFFAAEAQGLRHGPFLAQQRDGVLVAWQAVEVGAEVAREALELVERAGLLERRGVELDRGMRAVDAG